MVEHKTAEPQQAAEQQKMQCPFCKIVKGEIPSKKVYDDDHLMGVLDINPAQRGHTLLMPREHYPVMPLVPEQTFDRLFLVTKRMAEIIRGVFQKSGTTVFVANGAVAGQQSAHFMLHVIPRDDGDGMINFEIPHHQQDKSQHQNLFQVVKNNLQLQLKDRYGKFPLRDEQGNVVRLQATEKMFTKPQVLQIIESNPQLKDVIMKNPEEFIASIEKSPQLKQLFAHQDVEEIVKEVNPKYQPKKGKGVKAEYKEEKQPEQKQQEPEQEKETPPEEEPPEKEKEGKEQEKAGKEQETGEEEQSPEGKEEKTEEKEQGSEKKGQETSQQEQGKEEAKQPKQEEGDKADLDLISRLFG